MTLGVLNTHSGARFGCLWMAVNLHLYDITIPNCKQTGNFIAICDQSRRLVSLNRENNMSIAGKLRNYHYNKVRI